jgi:hypothetical protein
MLNEWRNEQWGTTLESLDPEDQSLEDNQTDDESSHSTSPLATPGGIAQILRKPKPLPSLKAQFQQVCVP